MSSRTAAVVAVSAAAIGLAIAALSFDLLGGGEATAGVGASRSGSTTDGEGDAAAARRDSVGSRDEASTGSSEVATAPTAAAAPAAQDGDEAGRDDGLALRGLALAGDSAEPAAAVELVLVQGDDFAFVETDADGRFETGPRYVAGVLEVRHRRSPPDGPHPVQLRVAPATIELAGAPGDAVEAVVRLHDPAGVLVVDVRGLDGSPVPGAEVEVEVALAGRAGRTILRAESGATGLARIGLESLGGEAAVGVIARLERDGAVALTSELRRLDTPLIAAALQQPVHLVLVAPGAIDIRVEARDGSPAPERMVLLDDLVDDLGWWTGPVPRTDRDGAATAEGLAPGRYRLHVRGAEGVPAQEVDVLPGERASLRFVLDAPRIELAVAGRLVDADGTPLPERSVDVRVLPAGTRDVVATDPEGRFEHFAPPGRTVVVDASEGIFSDVFEPDRLEVPFGATDVVLRRVRDIELRHVSFEVLREGTDKRVEGVLVMTYRAPDRGDYAFHRAEDGLASPRLPIDPSTRLVVEVEGFRRTEVTLDELTETVGDDGIGRVEVRPGLTRTIAVVAAEGGAAVPGARLSVRGREVARTDAGGIARLDLDLWPDGGVDVSADGFAPATWAPREGAADLAPARVALQRGD